MKAIPNKLFSLTMTGLLIAASSSWATQLTFFVEKNGAGYFGTTDSFNATPVLGQYGDHVDFGPASSGTTNIVAGSDNWTFGYSRGNGWTPDLTLAYTLGANTTRQEPYTDSLWPGVDWLKGAANADYYITFTPDSDQKVRVNSFDLRGFFNLPTGTWTLYGDSISGTILASGAWAVTVPPPAFNSFTTGMTDFYPGTVVLAFHNTTGGDVSLDNLNFDEVPEPTGVALLLATGALLFWRRTNR